MGGAGPCRAFDRPVGARERSAPATTSPGGPSRPHAARVHSEEGESDEHETRRTEDRLGRRPSCVDDKGDDEAHGRYERQHLSSPADERRTTGDSGGYLTDDTGRIRVAPVTRAGTSLPRTLGLSGKWARKAYWTLPVPPQVARMREGLYGASVSDIAPFWLCTCDSSLPFKTASVAEISPESVTFPSGHRDRCGGHGVRRAACRGRSAE